ncbi:reverse transcriptase domain-containing protein [Tanacetum coccineum]
MSARRLVPFKFQASSLFRIALAEPEDLTSSPPQQPFSPPSDYTTGAPPTSPIISPPLSPIKTNSNENYLLTPKSTPPPFTTPPPAPTRLSKLTSLIAINLDPIELLFFTPPSSPSLLDVLGDLPPSTTNPSPPKPSFATIERLENEPPPIPPIDSTYPSPTPEIKPTPPPFPPHCLPPPPSQLPPLPPLGPNNPFLLLTHEMYCEHCQRTQVLVDNLQGEMRFILNHILNRLNVGPPNKFTWYKNKALHTRIAAYSDQTRPDLTFVSTSWRHPWDPTQGITLRKMSTMANTTPVVTTVTKPATKEKTPKETDATPRVNIQDLCDEHYEDILSVIMDNIRRDKQKEVHARLDFEESPKRRRIREGSQNSSTRTLFARARSTDLVILTIQAQLNPDQTKQTLGIVPTVEPALIGGTPLTEIVLGAETAPVVLKNNMIIPTPPMGQGLNMDTAHVTETTPVMRKRGGKVNPLYPGYQRATPAMGDIRRAARVWFDELPPKSIDGYKDLKATFLAYFIQQKNYVKDPVEIHNIKQRDGETIEEFMERFKVETRRMKGAPKCMRISEFMHGVNNPELTKRLNEHVPKTMEEMMITTTAFIRGETVAIAKKKGHTSWRTQD